MSHEIAMEPVWQPNGAQGARVVCRTCDRVLWESSDAPADVSGEFVRVVGQHDEEQKKLAAARKISVVKDQQRGVDS